MTVWLGSRLKLMCRAGCLPVMRRVAWELDLNANYGTCPLCATNTAEDITHACCSTALPTKDIGRR